MPASLKPAPGVAADHVAPGVGASNDLPPGVPGCHQIFQNPPHHQCQITGRSEVQKVSVPANNLGAKKSFIR